ncbi:MAG: hypothetical protein ACRCYX_16340 [Dermatophilaceae bacterium]
MSALMISHDQNISEFHPAAWPRIRTVLELDTMLAAVVQRRAVAVLPREAGEAVAHSITAAVARVVADTYGSAGPVDAQPLDNFEQWVGRTRWPWEPWPRPNWTEDLLAQILDAGRVLSPIAENPRPSSSLAGPNPWPITVAGAEAGFVLRELQSGVEKFGSPALQESLIPVLAEAANSLTV